MSLSNLDLRLVAAIADLGSLSAAARALGRQKSTVSRELSSLEARIGQRLFHRSSRRLSLTEAGAVLAAYSRRITEEIAAAEAALESLQDRPRGTLRITTPPAILRFLLTPNLGKFRERYPELAILFLPDVSRLDLVEEGIDLALRVGELPDSSLAARQIASVGLGLVAATRLFSENSAPASPDDLGSWPLIDLAARANPRWSLTDRAGRITELDVSPALGIAEPGAVLDMVDAGLGIGKVPLLYAREGLRTKRLTRILPDYELGRRAVTAVYPSRRQLPPKVSLFVDFAAACFAEADRK